MANNSRLRNTTIWRLCNPKGVGILLLLLAMMSGCITKVERDSKRDSWRRKPEISHSYLEDNGWVQSSDFFVVSPDKRIQAIERLNKDPIIVLNKSDYISYGGLEDEYQQEYSFLVRSLVYYSNIEGYEIYFKGASVIVFHGSLGRKRVPRRKAPIVIHSRTAIDSVFVYCSQAR